LFRTKGAEKGDDVEGEFNGGLLCLIRRRRSSSHWNHSDDFPLNSIQCRSVDPIRSGLTYANDDELISHVIEITKNDEDEVWCHDLSKKQSSFWKQLSNNCICR